MQSGFKSPRLTKKEHSEFISESSAVDKVRRYRFTVKRCAERGPV